MSIFYPKQINFSNQSDWFKYLLIWRLSLLFVVLFAALTIVFAFDAIDTFLAYAAALAVSLSALIYLKLKKKFRAVFIGYAFAGTLIINISVILILDSPHFADFQWLLLIVFLTFFGLGMRWGFAFLGVNMIPIVYFNLFVLNNHIKHLPEQALSERIMISAEMVACYFAIGYVIYQFLKMEKIAENRLRDKNKILNENNAVIQKSIEEKTLLVKEIHHRVKNNLQIIISLLRLQMTDVKTQEAKDHFSEAINRVMVMSSIHQKLYRQEDITEFKLDNYINELANELKVFFKEDFPIEIEIKSEFQNLDLKTIVPLGLILNELFSNSFKYAFEKMASGKIILEIKDGDEQFVLEYSDNGAWKKSSDEVAGFGLELIDMLTEQLNGSKTFKTNEDGTNYVFYLNKINE
jgi:two-component system, sensor histidine kinase PdtaS